MGYGLTDVKTRKWKIADGRINTKSPLLDYDSDVKLSDYIDWLEARQAEDDLGHFNIDCYYVKETREPGYDWYKQTGVFEPAGLVHHGIEYMEKNVLLIRPLFFEDWRRYDDPLDYIEETFKSDDGQINWYREIPGGIFPYSGSFMNAKTGDYLKNGIDLWRYLTWDSFKNILTEDQFDKVSQEFGFNDTADARINLKPIVPECVKDLCEWGKLFKDPGAWKQLRPLIYTYWS